MVGIRRKYFPVTLPDFPLTISLPWHQDLPTRSEGRQQFVEAGFVEREGEQPNRLGLMEVAAKEMMMKKSGPTRRVYKTS